jgi:hypothetical protein
MAVDILKASILQEIAAERQEAYGAKVSASARSMHASGRVAVH